jgi:hypothetical protein
MNAIKTICIAALLATATGAFANPFGKPKADEPVRNFGASNAYEQKSYSSQLGKTNAEVFGYKSTTVTGGYKTDGGGSPIRGDNTGSRQNDAVGVGIRYRY